MEQANPINISQIDHVVLRARDFERMISFYRDVLGCRLERGPGEIGLAQLRAGRSLIDIVDASGPLGLQGGRQPDHSAPNVDHICLQVDPWDTDVIEKHLQRMAVEYDPVTTRYGAAGMGPSIYFRDPEGNTIELKGMP
ncbi:Virulence protein [Halioglobus japonicus]|nr:Virulence protein [Halioglobus japonicus]